VVAITLKDLEPPSLDAIEAFFHQAASHLKGLGAVPLGPPVHEGPEVR